MTLMRGFAKVDEKRKIAIPSNICREAGLEAGQLVELKINGPQGAQYLIVHKRGSAR